VTGPAGGLGADGAGRPSSDVLSVSLDTVRLFLHILAATVWVGGQITLAGLVPGLRALSPDAPRAAARRFNRIAWPAFAVLVLTGMWNVAAARPGDNLPWDVTLAVKLVVVAVSGIAALLHSHSRSTAGLAVFGALSAAGALGAVFLGVMLAGS